MTGVTCWLSEARLACALCTGSLAASVAFAAFDAFAPQAGRVLKLAEEPVLADSVAAALRAGGDDEPSLWPSDEVDAAEAGDEPPPGPHASSMIVASATTAAVDRAVDTRSSTRILMCASVLWGWVAHSFVVVEEKIVKYAKTFARNKNVFANVSEGKHSLANAF
jgi:hypothetical protein